MLRLLVWNALLLLVGVMLVAIAGEAFLRLTMPLVVPNSRWKFVPNVGTLRPPNTEIRSTNGLDFWTVSRTNSLGFLDREPPSAERAAATCHISIIGDSFVEAREVPIHDKFQVRLEELAADELPHLNITTSAFGIGGTGQVQQLPFYDEYARLLHPRLLVLVFAHNDFHDNTPGLRGLRFQRRDRRNFLEPMVRRRSDGKLELAWSRPRDQLSELLDNSGISSIAPPPLSWAARGMEEAVQRSRFVRWLRDKKIALFPSDHDRRHELRRDVEAVKRQPLHATPLYTHFALEQFKQRADRDGVKLVILASYKVKLHGVKLHGTHIFERLSQMAATLDIPVIDQADYILRQSNKLTDAFWPHDGHWNFAGHRWAAESLLEYIEEHPAVCDGLSGVPASILPRGGLQIFPQTGDFPRSNRYDRQPASVSSLTGRPFNHSSNLSRADR